YWEGKDSAALATLLNDNRWLRDRYLRLHAYSAYQEDYTPSLYFPAVYVGNETRLIWFAHLDQLVAQKKSDEALRLLAADVRCWRMMLRPGNTLLAQMIANNNLLKDLQYAAKLIAWHAFAASRYENRLAD